MGYADRADEGHAWAIAFAAFVITLILSGISKMGGIMYVAVIDTYGVTRQMATLPFTFRKSLRCLAGPIVGVVGQRFGVRAVTIVGAVVAALGPALSFFAPDIAWLAICWGGIHGLGEAFANTLFQVVVNQYFEKYRSTASGVAMSGACVGSIVFSFLIETLRNEYGLQGTFLVLAGVILNVLPAGMMLRPPSWFRTDVNDNNPVSQPKQTVVHPPKVYTVSGNYVKSNAEKGKICGQQILLEKNEILSLTNCDKTGKSIANLVKTLEKKLQEQRSADNLTFAEDRQRNSFERRLSIKNVFPTSKDKIYERSLSVNSSIGTCFKDNPFEAVKGKKMSTSGSIKTIFKLFTNPLYLLVCVSMATYVFVFIPINTSVVDYTKDRGLPESFGKYLIHAMAVGDIAGRLCLGWVTDKDLVSLPRYIACSLLLQGAFVIALPFASSFAVFLLLLACYTMSTGSMLIRFPIFVLKHVQNDQQAVAIGSYGFVSGLVPFGVPFLIGHFRDGVGSYDGMYYLLGSLTLLSAMLWICEPLLSRINKDQEIMEQNKEGV